jgi:hypothetical protein
MGEARLPVVLARARPEVLLPRSGPGWVSRSGRCPGTGQSRWLGDRVADRGCRRSRGGRRRGRGRLCAGTLREKEEGHGSD